MVEDVEDIAKHRRELFIRVLGTEALLQALDEKHATSQPRMRGARESQKNSLHHASEGFVALGTYSNIDSVVNRASCSSCIAVGHARSVHRAKEAAFLARSFASS